MSQDRPSSRDGSTKIINMNHVLTHPTSQIQYNSNNNNNNNLIINKNHFLAIETAKYENGNTHLLHKNLNTMPSISSTTSSIATPMSYISKYIMRKKAFRLNNTHTYTFFHIL